MILLAALACDAQPLGAQASNEDENVRVEVRLDEALQPLAQRETLQAASALQNDARAAARIAGDQRVRIVSVERHEEDKYAPTDQRRADVVVYNYDTNETVSAVVTLGLSPVVEELTVAPGQPLALGAEEVAEAQQLALAHPAVQAALRASGLAEREGELVVTHIRVQTDVPDDPCSTDRCVALFLNTREGVIDIQPIVNLTTGEVEVQ